MLSRLRSVGRRWCTWVHVLVLAALAYVPALTAAPGRMPADTKLYLYLDPQRATSDALSSWDNRQFAGWVPHQTVSYLWPSGPWFSVMDRLGVPDWVAHRLWLGTVLVAGGLGVRWAARRLGLAPAGALVAALVYQLSPYVLPYVSRTSVMLLPWAGVGWLVGLTVGAATRTKWRDVALFGVVMATVASVNATATVMIAPAPILWLVHAAWARTVAWRQAAVTALKLAAVGLFVSLWWVVMLAIEGRFGADVLGYSESLQATSFTTTSAEVLRGMGYWLFYVRDPIGFTTTASFRYMTSGRLITISFAVLLVSLAGFAVVRWGSRRYAVLLVFTGVVLAVGAHPIDHSSPLMAIFADRSRSSVTLALRSSARAMPVSSFGMALGAGALAAAVCATRWRLRAAVPWVAGLLAVANLPVLFNGGLVDPVLSRQQDPPAAWRQAAAALDGDDRDARVLQVPGTEFGAFRWGYTVDPPVPGMARKPLVTRDLLPLGSAAAMDLLYALDDRFQEGRAELSSVAPVARLLGADTVWLPNDVAFERFRTPRPELVARLFAGGDPGFGAPVDYGPPAVNDPAIAMVDEQAISEPSIGTALAPVELVPVNDPQPIMRAKTGTTVVAGSGDGLVDAAAAGLISGNELIRYSADLAAKGELSAVAGADHVVVTDSNRTRAHQWRGSQDVWGFTEDGGTGLGDSGVLRADSADARLPLFPGETADDQTIAEQRGGVRMRASSYGTPSAYLPEDRPALAGDGDLSTAWLVDDRAPAEGAYLRIDAPGDVSTLTLVQPQDQRNRWITAVTVTDGAGSRRVELTDASRTARGQAVELGARSTSVTVTIATTAHGPLAPGEGLDAVGFAEVGTGGGPLDEVVRLPANVLPHVQDGQQLDVVLTRLRTRATNRWRGDPELSLARAFTLERPRAFMPAVTARLDQRASDEVLAGVLGWRGTTADRRLAGVPAMGGWAATDGDAGTAWMTPFGMAVGATLTVPLNGGQAVTSLRISQPAGSYSRITELRVATDSGERTVAVPAPGANGLSLVAFDALTGPDLRLTITATDGSGTIDRRYGEWTVLPAAISEVAGAGITAAPLPAAIDSGCRDDLLTVDGAPLAVRLTGAVTAAFAGWPLSVEMCAGTGVDLSRGEHLVRSATGLRTGFDIDRVVLRSAPNAAPSVLPPAPTVTLLRSDRTSRRVEVGACPGGCWFVFGEGYNTGWQARGDGHDLGTPIRVDGGFNGWYLPPGSPRRTIELTWRPQRTFVSALVLSAAAVLLCLFLALLDRDRHDVQPADGPVLAAPWKAAGPRRWPAMAVPVAVAAVSGLLVINLLWGAICAAVAAAACLGLRRPRLLGVVAVALAAYIGLVLVRRVTSEHPFANAGWPYRFEDLHRPGMAIVVLLLAAVCTPERSPAGDDAER